MRSATLLFNVAGGGRLNAANGGAIERVVAYHIERFAEEFDVTVFGDLHPLSPNVRAISHLSRIHLTDHTTLIDTTTVLRGVAKMLAVKADVVVATHPRNLLMSLLYGRLRRAAVVDWDLDHIPWTPPLDRWKGRYHCWVRRCDCVVTESAEQVARMLSFGIPEAKIRNVPISIDTARYAPGGGARAGASYLLYVAKFTPRKNQLLLLRVFERIRESRSDLNLVLVGPTSGHFTGAAHEPSEYFRECEQFVEKRGLGACVRFAGMLEEAELIEAYRGAALYVFPSREEAFGMSLLEAMSCGCACIANDVAPLPEVLGTAGVLVNVEDEEAFGRALLALLDNPRKCSDLGFRARQRAEEEFGEKIHQRLREILVAAV